MPLGETGKANRTVGSSDHLPFWFCLVEPPFYRFDPYPVPGALERHTFLAVTMLIIGLANDCQKQLGASQMMGAVEGQELREITRLHG